MKQDLRSGVHMGWVHDNLKIFDIRIQSKQLTDAQFENETFPVISIADHDASDWCIMHRAYLNQNALRQERPASYSKCCTGTHKSNAWM